VKTRKGQEIKALSNEDEQEATTEKILLEPWAKNTEGLNKEQTIEGMKQEIRSMKAQQVYTEVSFSNLTKAQQSKAIKSRWVLRQKGNSVRARIVVKDTQKKSTTMTTYMRQHKYSVSYAYYKHWHSPSTGSSEQAISRQHSYMPELQQKICSCFHQQGSTTLRTT
jgi:hypothetical protein